MYRLLCLFIFLPVLLSAQPGKNGAVTITSASSIVNAYTFLTANAASGAATISVASSTLGSNFTAPLSAGDLVFIIQMQGATLNGTAVPGAGGMVGSPNDSTWGAISAYNNSGRSEFAVVASVPSSTSITLSCPLQNSYTSLGRVQVIRVPRYSSLTINAGGSITAPAWNGSTGGVVVTEVSGTTTINGSINVNGLGFRGGALENTSVFGALNYAATASGEGAEKGEGIGGYQADYATYGGRYGMGAPANGGGGGNGHTAGGGGGANAGILTGWSGKGIPDISNATWAQAWNLEYNGFANSSSPGGGRGGYGFSGSNANALTTGPNNAGAWGGDGRPNRGGLGGRPLDYSGGRLFMGGGGGAGETDNNMGGAGGNGGGMVYILSYGAVTGNGTITANGADGGDAAGTPPLSNYSGKDGAGGGGGGGTIIVKASSGVSGVNLNAQGGNGGDQILTAGPFYFGSINEAEGPGGGGGGGYVSITTGAPVVSVSGGANGTTNSNALTEFIPNGATRGSAGISQSNLPVFSVQVNDTSICGGSQVTVPAIVSGVLPVGTSINWYTSSTSSAPVSTGNSFTISGISSSTTYYYGTCPGTFRDSFTVSIQTPPAITITQDSSICAGDTVPLNASGGTSYSWSPASGLSNSNIGNPLAFPLSTTTYVVTVSAANGCQTQDSVTITVSNNVALNISPDTSICSGDTVQLSAGAPAGSTVLWSPAAGLSGTGSQSPFASPSSTTLYYANVSTASGCMGIDSVLVTVNPLPQADAGADDTICAGNSSALNGTANGGTAPYSYNWSNGFSGAGPNNISATGDSTITLTVTDQNGCNSLPDSVTVFVGDPLSVSIISSADSICTGDSVILNATVSGGDGNYTYTWNPAGTGTAQQVYHPAVSFVYSVTVGDGCGTSPVSANGNVEVVSPGNAAFNAFELKGCPPHEVAFTDLSGWGNAWFWEFGDGSTSSQKNPVHIYTESGIYDVIFSVSLGSCSTTDTVEALIEVYNEPVADYTFTPESPVVLGTAIQFTSTGTGEDSYFWDFSDSITSVFSNPNMNFPDTGVYYVTLWVSNIEGCHDSITKRLLIYEELEFPNVFTPNGDGQNDLFRIRGLKGSGNVLTIFNRWGNKVYEHPDYDQSWDGSNLSAGTYYYLLQDHLGKHHSGFLTLLR